MTARPASSDLPTRFAAGVLMIGIALAAILWGGWAFRILVGIGAAVMMLEWADIHRVPRTWAWFGIALLAATLWGAAEYFYPVGADAGDLAPQSFAPAFAFALLLGLASRRLAMGWGFLYIAVPAFALLILSWLWFALVLWVMAVTWATDIFGYFAGRSIGGPKLAPRISPNKTWAGLIGAMAGAALAGALVAWAFDLGPVFMWSGAAMGLAAQLGDLYESSVKRRAGVKDSGTILPGHGGVLDRVDGLLPVAVLTLALVMAGLWVP